MHMVNKNFSQDIIFLDIILLLQNLDITIFSYPDLDVTKPHYIAKKNPFELRYRGLTVKT